MFTFEEVGRAMEAVVERAGVEHKYAPSHRYLDGHLLPEEEWEFDGPGTGSCYYAPDAVNPEGCLIGAVVRELGLDVTLLIEDQSPSQQPLLKERLHETAIMGLTRAQIVQDEGGTWGEALADYLTATRDGWGA